jgi:hypothetical protein
MKEEYRMQLIWMVDRNKRRREGRSKEESGVRG